MLSGCSTYRRAAAEPETFSQPYECKSDLFIPPEAEITNDDPQGVDVLHDPEKLVIVKGADFPDIISFRKAARHYAIKKGFAFANLKTDQTRFYSQVCS